MWQLMIRYWLKKYSIKLKSGGVMRRSFGFVMLLLTVFMACCSTRYSDGKSVSERILKIPQVDTLAILNAVTELDTLITPEIFGRDFAMTLVSVSESDTIIDSKELYRRVTILRNIYTKKEGEKIFRRFQEGIQSYIDGLPVERKMMFYTKIAMPEQLGTALRIDKYHNQDDSVEINEQVQILRKIYNNDEFSSFMKYFKR